MYVIVTVATLNANLMCPNPKPNPTTSTDTNLVAYLNSNHNTQKFTKPPKYLHISSCTMALWLSTPLAAQQPIMDQCTPDAGVMHMHAQLCTVVVVDFFL